LARRFTRRSPSAPVVATTPRRIGCGRLALAAALLLAPLSLALAGCASAPSPLKPSSDAADSIRWLWWILFGIAVVIFGVVVVLLVWGAHRQPTAEEEQHDHPFGTRLVWIGGIIIPIIVLALVFGLSIAQMSASGGQSNELTVQVIGHQWWWEVQYPQSKVTTANEIHIPVGQRVNVLVTSADVIHAFWVPELQGKMDAIPGQSNSIQLEASKAGTYRGDCLTYCGLQHANMNFLVVAESQDQFTSWLSGQSTTPSPPSDPQLLHGQQVLLSSACAYCHTIDGTNASGKAGPDLTHLASRQQIAAGTLPNTAGALGGWIVDPQTAKPGNKMPPENFSGPDLQALIAYLESLK
jgi:cytochrome c oxidase subunit 2